MDLGFSALLSWLAGLAQLIFCTLVKWVCWFLDYFFQMVWIVLKTVIPTIPTDVADSLSWLPQWYGALESWIPMSDAVLPIVGFWVTISLNVIAIRILRRMLPF